VIVVVSCTSRVVVVTESPSGTTVHSEFNQVENVRLWHGGVDGQLVIGHSAEGVRVQTTGVSILKFLSCRQVGYWMVGAVLSTASVGLGWSAQSSDVIDKDIDDITARMSVAAWCVPRVTADKYCFGCVSLTSDDLVSQSLRAVM